MKLTDLSLRSLSAPARGQKLYYDNALPSFGLRVSQGGTRSFFLQYGADRRFITIGRYPVISLAEARGEAKRILAEHTLGKIRPQSMTFPQAVALFLEEKTKSRRSRTVYDYRRLFARVSFKGQLADLNHAELAHVLRRFTAPSEYNHLLVAFKVFFNWCIKRRYIEHNPTAGLSPHGTPQRSRVLTDEELRRIWYACERGRAAANNDLPWLGTSQPTIATHQPNELQETQSGKSRSLASQQYSRVLATEVGTRTALSPTFCSIVKLLILTGQRRGEIAALQNQFIDFDNKVICIPAILTKNGREHTFPISQLTASVLKSSTKKEVGAFLFPARGGSGTCFNGWSKSSAALWKITGIEGATLHDLRRSYASNMARIGVPLHIIEKLLNHVSGSFGGIVGVYQRHEFKDEMAEAVQKYENFIASIVG